MDGPTENAARHRDGWVGEQLSTLEGRDITTADVLQALGKSPKGHPAAPESNNPSSVLHKASS